MSANKSHFEALDPAGSFRVASWNLLRRIGAEAQDVAKLVHAYRPDLLLLQEATEEIAALPSLVGGHFFRHPMQKRIYGLAAWSPHPFPSTSALRLPASVLPGRVPPRIAQIVKFQGICFANVHLSHGQLMNRRQLRLIAGHLPFSAMIIGDCNMVGPALLPGFRDIGARGPTHDMGKVVPLRLDRCFVRNLSHVRAEILGKAGSDHAPIAVWLDGQSPRPGADSAQG